jgi:hypothetical protein
MRALLLGAWRSNNVKSAGKRMLFSEQQMMDCSWGHGLNAACDGGDYDGAMDYLKLAGGPIEEKKYEYLGADGFCRQKNFTSGGMPGFEVSSDHATAHSLTLRGVGIFIDVATVGSPYIGHSYGGRVLKATDFCRAGRAVIQPSSFPDTEHGLKATGMSDPGDVRFEDCQLYKRIKN